MFSKIKNCRLRDYWRSEPTDFTNWLSNNRNIELLGKSIGLNLEFLAKEVTNNSRLRVDITARDTKSGEIVIIENQLEKTDHSHLGQIITYASIFNSRKIVWIVKDVRPELEQAVIWLNRNTKMEISIYLVRIQVVKIGSSNPAPLFTLISKPDEQAFPRVVVELEKAIENIYDEDYYIRKKCLDPSIVDFFNSYILPGKTYLKRGRNNRELGLYEMLYDYNKSIAVKYDIPFSRDFLVDLNFWAKEKGYTINADQFRRTGDRRIKKGNKEYYHIEKAKFSDSN